MQKGKNTVKASTVKTAGIANLNAGAIYTAPASGWCTGASVQQFAAKHAAGSLANIIVQPTAYFISLGITPANWVKHASGMFCTNTGTRGHQLQCYLQGVQANTIATNKRKAFKTMQLATIGGNGASNNLGVIAKAVTASGGKIITGNIASGNTLCMLLSGTNSATKKHAFFGKPLVQLVVKPAVTIK